MLFLFIAFQSVLQAQSEFTIAFYNLLNYPTAPPANREEILAGIIEEIQPHIFMVCELESNAGSVEILDGSLNTGSMIYASAPYQNNMSSGSDLQQLVYYDTERFELVETDIVGNDLRDINRYTLQLLTEDTGEPQLLEIFITHLKAGSSDSDQSIRLDMIEDFATYLQSTDFDPNSQVIFAGDLNISSSTEASYQLLLNNGTIPLNDPLDAPGDWNNNPSFSTIHTQSTRISNNDFDDFGAGGGMDSRFDFILFSDNLLDNQNDISYIDDTYSVLGNNGNCFNNRIDAAGCSGEFSSTLRSLLYNMSDHLPIVAQLQITNQFLSINDIEKPALARFVKGNLVTDQVEIAFAEALPLPNAVILYDQVGRHLQKIKVRSTTMNIPLTTFSSGIYFIAIDGQSRETLKFVKTR